MRKESNDTHLCGQAVFDNMSEVETFFRYCPACGKRFHIKLVGKRLVRDEREEKTKEKQASYDGFYGTPMQWANPTVLKVDVPITVEAEDFEYTYKCGECGHVWTEMHHRETEVR
jgi:DNA-directed RNA polymerase subunit RPC12/RpoP